MKSKYFGVSYDKRTQSRSSKKWRGRVTTDNGVVEKSFETEREAAKYVDLVLIRIQKQPRNILKAI